MKLDILAFGAHPDDVELGAGASIAKEIHNGKKVGIIDLTKGELGTRGNEIIREKESREAAKFLGVSLRKNLDLGDVFFEINDENLLKVVQEIRTYKPEIVLINSIKDRHPDHSRASQLVSRACFISGLIKVETELDNKLQSAWRPKQVFSYIQWQGMKPDFVVDISDFIDVKLNSILKYKSQFFDPNSKEIETPISSQQFLNSIKNTAEELGRYSGVKFGEGFKSEKYPLVNSLFDLQ